MSAYHDRLERSFEQLAYGISQRPWLVILVMLALTAGLAYGIRFIQSDTSNEAFLHQDDPILLAYEDFREQFGRDDFIVIALEPEKGIFDPQFLLGLKKVHTELRENTPHLDDIISMINVRSTEGRGDTLYVDDLLAAWPQGKEELAAFEKKVMSNPLYLNRLVSKDAAFTTVVLKLDAYVSQSPGADPLAGFDEASGGGALDGFDGQNTEEALSGFEEDAAPKGQVRRLSDDEISAIVRKVKGIMKAHEGQGYSYYMAGTPVVSDMLKQSMIRDMTKFMRMVVLIIGAVLLILFRRISGVLMPLFIVGTVGGRCHGLHGLGEHQVHHAAFHPAKLFDCGGGGQLGAYSGDFLHAPEPGRHPPQCHSLRPGTQRLGSGYDQPDHRRWPGLLCRRQGGPHQRLGHSVLRGGAAFSGIHHRSAARYADPFSAKSQEEQEPEQKHHAGPHSGWRQ
jgi:hypothetical protein